MTLNPRATSLSEKSIKSGAIRFHLWSSEPAKQKINQLLLVVFDYLEYREAKQDLHTKRVKIVVR